VQGYDRYAYVNNSPVRYTDPTGHCGPICIGLAVLGVAYVASRGLWEGAASIQGAGVYEATRDKLGGDLVTEVSETISEQAEKHSVDPTLIAAVLRHESPAGERRLFTLLPLTQPGTMSNFAETIEAYVRIDGTASIGPGQMQLRRAELLEELGYVTPRDSKSDRIRALLGKESSVEYVAGMLHYTSDQLKKIPGYSELRPQFQDRLTLIGYNQGWTLAFWNNIQRFGFEGLVAEARYDNQTLDEYVRWRNQNRR
jgi:hypothetical protein